MRKVGFIVLCMIGLIIQLSAQNPKGKMNSGVVALDAGRLEDGLEKLKFAADNADQLKDKDKPKLYYYLGKAYYQLSLDSTLSEQEPNAVFLATENYQKAIDLEEEGGKFSSLFEIQDKQNLWAALLNGGINAYQAEDYENALKYFANAKDIRPEEFNTNRLLGLANYMSGDTTKAIEGLRGAIDAYKENPLEDNADNNEIASSVFQLLASVYNQQKDIRSALDLLDEGLELFPEDKNLVNFQLGLYQENPEFVSEAEAKFTEAISKDPDNEDIKIAYGQLLEKTDKGEKAEGLYKEILNTNADSYKANYSLGVYYINKAAEMSEAKMKLDGNSQEAEIDKMNTDIKNMLKEAYPYMKWLHNNEPSEKEWLNQLVIITSYFEDKQDEHEQYNEKLSALNSGGSE